MKTTDFLAYLLKLFGVYLFVLFLRSVPAEYTNIQQLTLSSDRMYTAAVFLGYSNILFLALFSFVLFRFPKTIAKLLTRDDSDVDFNIEKSGIVKGGFILLGIYILSWAIPDFIHNAASIMFLQKYDQFDSYAMSEAILAEFATVIEIIIGLYLALKANGLYLLVSKLRG